MNFTNNIDSDGNPMVIDILKMDIEGGEYEWIEWFSKQCASVKINQLQIEFHVANVGITMMWNSLQSLLNCGFRIFHKDPNRISDATGKGSCFEVAFVHERFIKYLSDPHKPNTL